MRLAIALMGLAAPAFADYSEHATVRLFTELPCENAITTIETEETTLEALAFQGMAWGFLLGFDAANDGLQGDATTTLVRLKAACAESPEIPAATLLQSFR